MTDWLTPAGLQTLENGYLLEGETPEQMYRRLARTAASYYKGFVPTGLEELFYEAMMKNWLCPASPVLTNLGTDRGFPISCFGLTVPDSVLGIFNSNTELAMMSKMGGGVGISLSHIRGRGAAIKGNGSSEGIVPWAKIYDTTIMSVSQGATRRGAGSLNLRLTHSDAGEYLRIRRPQGDLNRQCLNLNHCVQVSDDFMEKMLGGDTPSRELWLELLRARIETGEPYIMFEDTVNKANPDGYKRLGLTVDLSNLCSEITLRSDDENSFVCCLSSLNLAKYDDWVDYKFSNGMTLPELAMWFLDGVMQEFITKAKGVEGFKRAVSFAQKSRAIGLGVLGWHTYLQEHGMLFDTSVETMGLNSRIFKFMQQETQNASRNLASLYTESEWCRGTGMFHSHTMALAPTVTNALISGGVSPSIEPITANAFSQKTAKGTFMYRNPSLETLLDSKGKNTSEVWQYIVANEGSVQQLDVLSAGEKELFLTAREINQYNLIRQAAARQPFIDQSQSLNLFFPSNVDPKWFHNLHVDAWKLGVKTLYYCRSGSVLKGDVASRFYDEACVSCEG